jgi:hypothetical protein
MPKELGSDLLFTQCFRVSLLRHKEGGMMTQRLCHNKDVYADEEVMYTLYHPSWLDNKGFCCIQCLKDYVKKMDV